MLSVTISMHCENLCLHLLFGLLKKNNTNNTVDCIGSDESIFDELLVLGDDEINSGFDEQQQICRCLLSISFTSCLAFACNIEIVKFIGQILTLLIA